MSTSQGEAMATNRPTQLPPSCVSAICTFFCAGGSVAHAKTGARYMPEAVTELDDQRAQVRILLAPELASDQLLPRYVAALLVVLQPRAPFVAAARALTELDSDSHRVEVAEAEVG